LTKSNGGLTTQFQKSINNNNNNNNNPVSIVPFAVLW